MIDQQCAATMRGSKSPDAHYEHTSADVAPELFDGFTESR